MYVEKVVEHDFNDPKIIEIQKAEHKKAINALPREVLVDIVNQVLVYCKNNTCFIHAETLVDRLFNDKK